MRRLRNFILSPGVGFVVSVYILVLAWSHTGFWWGAIFGAQFLLLLQRVLDGAGKRAIRRFARTNDDEAAWSCPVCGVEAFTRGAQTITCRSSHAPVAMVRDA